LFGILRLVTWLTEFNTLRRKGNWSSMGLQSPKIESFPPSPYPELWTLPSFRNRKRSPLTSWAGMWKKAR
jgi:hypothetical protein